MDINDIPEFRQLGRPQPRVEQTLMKMAVETLNSKQKEIWFLHNNERLTQDEIARHFKVTQPSVHQQIQVIEKKLIKYCERNKGAYMLLKLEHKIMNEETE